MWWQFRTHIEAWMTLPSSTFATRGSRHATVRATLLFCFYPIMFFISSPFTTSTCIHGYNTEDSDTLEFLLFNHT